jgi:hypothetical protein
MDKLAKITNEMSLQQVGSMFAASGFFQDTKGEAQALTKILAGAENGFGAFASMSGIHIIKGKMEVGADLIATAVKRSGKYDFRVKKLTNDVAEIEFFECSDFTGVKWQSIGVSTFSIEDAKKAGASDMYKKYARNMLYARAMSNGQAWFCPDVFQSRVYSEGEISGLEGQYFDVEPEKTAVEDQKEIQDALEKGWKAIRSLWNEYRIGEDERKRSIKKHFHIDSGDVKECRDIKRLRDYYKSHRKQYSNKKESVVDGFGHEEAKKGLQVVCKAYGEQSEQAMDFTSAWQDEDWKDCQAMIKQAEIQMSLNEKMDPSEIGDHTPDEVPV